MNPRIAEIVGELDRLVPIEGAEVIARVELFWQTHPHVARYEQPTEFVATPSGFVRFGIALMKEAVGPRTPDDRHSFDLDPILRQDSNLEIAWKRGARAVDPARNRTPGLFDWPDLGGSDAPARLPSLLRELDTLVSWGEAELAIEAPYLEDVIAMTGNEAGVLRLGLEFAKAGFAPAVAKGRHGGVRVAVDLAYLGVCDLQFECERVPALPAAGLTDRSTEIPMVVGIGIVVTIAMLALRACLAR